MTMKAVYLEAKSGPESLILGELPKPSPGPGEAVVRVHATAVMPTEFQWFPTFNQPSGEPRPFPIVLSHEFSGVIESLGPNVQSVREGASVYGLNNWFVNGAQAEFCVAAVSALAPKPNSIDHVHAAVVPISALTAWQGLFDKGGLQKGQRVLVHGGAGAVGTFAVQMAHHCQAHVIATASSRNLEFVGTLGADEVLDYRTTRFENVVRDVDLVFDGVGGKTLEQSWAVLARGGRVVTYATGGSEHPDKRVRDAFFLVEPSGIQLAEIAGRIDAGELRVVVSASFPLAKAADAYRFSQEGGKRGKVALHVLSA